MKRLLATPIIAITLTVLLGGSVTLGAIYIGGTGRTGEVNLQKGLIGHWKFDGNSKDSSPHENNGSGTPKKPSDISGLELWMDAGTISGLSDDDPIEEWLDLSDQENHATQTTEAKKPTYKTNILNSKPVVRFSEDLMDFTSVITQGGEYTRFIVMKAVGDGFYWSSEDVSTNQKIGKWLGSYFTRMLLGGANDSTQAWPFGNGYGIIHEQRNSADKVDVSFDGGSLNRLFGDVAQTGNAMISRIGSGEATTQWFDGDIAEMVVFNRALSETERYDISLYLSAKYGIGISTPSFVPTLAADRKGETQKVYSFNGTSNYINTSLVRSDLGSSYSISVWFKYDGTSGRTYSPIIGSIDPSGGTEFFIGKNTGNTNIGVQDGNYVSNLVTGSDAFDGSWHHMVFTNSGGTGVIYLDGVYKNTSAFTGSNDVEQITIGFEDESSGYYWIGSVDDVRMYNRVLTADEALALYESYDPAPRISDLQKGLVGHWKFDSDAKDFTPNQNNGTVSGATLTTDRKGESNKAYSFNGTTDYVGLGQPSVLNTGITDITIAAWVKLGRALGSNGTNYEIFANEVYLSYGYLFRVEDKTDLPTSGRIHFRTSQSGVATGITAGNQSYPNDQAWHYVVATKNGTVGKIYVDGEEVSSYSTYNALSNPVDSTSNSQIGGLSSQKFNGSIDDVRIYNRALSAIEITDLYESYDPAPRVSNLQKGLVGRWIGPYGNTSAITRDLTPYENTGTVTGATLTTDRKGESDKAYSFNATAGGTSRIVTLPSSSLGNAFTASGWGRATGYGSEISIATRLITSWRSSGSTRWALGLSSTGEFNTLVANLAGAHTSSTGTIVPLNTWFHWAITYDGTIVKAYLNGALDISHTPTNGMETATNDNVRIGIFDEGATGTARRAWIGQINDVRIYNRALSPTEITELYESYQ